MRFRKSKTQPEEVRFPGRKLALDGHAALYAVELMASDAVVVHSSSDLTEVTGPLKNLAPEGCEPVSNQPVLIRETAGPRQLAGTVAGYAVTGFRTAALTSSLDGAHEALHASAGGRLTCVFNLTCRALKRHAGSLHCGHDEYYLAADAGFFQLFAKNAQEVADFTLIAHRVAELSLTPGICAQDFYLTSHSVQNVRLPEKALVLDYLGRPGDVIDSPTPAQSMLFAGQRRRIPRLVDRDQPAGIGGVQDQESYFKALAAQRSFFSDFLGPALDQAMLEYGESTGRHYEKVSGYRTEDAEFVVMAQGAVVEALEEIADYLRDKEKIKAGVVNLSVYRPFPGPELTRLLKGKSAVTVLERTDQPLAEDLPMLKEVRCAFDKAIENGYSGGDALPHSAYEAYRRPSDRPLLLSGVYGAGGGNPSAAELMAVFKNMASATGRKTLYYLGVETGRPTSRYPHLQTFQQRIGRDYPEMEKRFLAGVGEPPPSEQRAKVIQLHSLSNQGGLFAANLFAQSAADSLGWSVRTHPLGGLEQNLQPTCVTVAHAEEPQEAHAGGNFPIAADTVLVTSNRFLESIASRFTVKKGGALIVGSSRSPESLWKSMSHRTAQWVRDRELRIFVIDAGKIGTETASKPSFIDQLAVWSLFGAYFSSSAASPEKVEQFLGGLQARLTRLFGADHSVIKDVATAVTRGAGEPREMTWREWPDNERPPAVETDAPWTVEHVRRSDGTVFDPARFWRSVGYFYDNGRVDETVVDPLFATGIIPARSSAHRDMSSYRLRVPEWLPENCTGCGLCWTYCPDSALPPTIQSLTSLVQTALKECQREGAGMIQMQRISEQLAKLAYRLFVKDGVNQYLAMGPLLKDAFSELIEKMGAEGEQLETMTGEFDLMCARLENYPVAKTETFFEKPHDTQKGSGMLLSIALNPLSCKGCGLCLEVCPEDALKWTGQGEERLERYQKNWDFQMLLPDAPEGLIDGCVSPNDPESQAYRLLDKSAYHSLVGGDGAYPGNSVKIAVHLVTGTIESVMRPRFLSHVDRLTKLIERVEQRIQGKVSDVVKINDFEEFGHQLTRLDRKGLDADNLARLLGGDLNEIDQEQLRRLSLLMDQLKQQRQLYSEGVGGFGRARMAMAVDAGAASLWSGIYPDNPHSYPWVCQLPGDAPAMAEGVFEGLVRTLAEDFIVCRRAELELDETYDPSKHDEYFENFGWNDFDKEEMALVPPVLVLGQTGVTRWDDVSRLLSRGYPTIVVLVDTQGLAVADKSEHEAEQRLRRVTPDGGEDVGILALTKPDVFVLQTTVGAPGHLIGGVAESLNRKGPALLHVYAPDPHVHGFAPQKVAEQARLAYQSRAFPLFLWNPERPAPLVAIESNPDSKSNWTRRQVTIKDSTGVESQIETPLTVAEWAVNEARFRPHFRIVSKGRLNPQMVPMAEYLELAPDRREGLEAYVDVTDDKQQRVLAVVSKEMIAATERRQRIWTRLREMAVSARAAGSQPARAAAAGPDAEAPQAQAREPQPAADTEAEVHQKLTEKLLSLCGYTQDPDFFKQSLRDYITRNNQE